MSRTAQMFDSDDPAALKRLERALYSRPARLFASACPKAAALAALLALAACGVGGFTLEKAEVDRSILTGSTSAGSVSAVPEPADAELASDQATIRNAVSSADLEELSGRPLPWANSETGSRGAVTNLVQSGGQPGGQSGGKSALCRAFEVSRERFDGVAMFRGQACMSEAGDWRLDNFSAL